MPGFIGTSVWFHQVHLLEIKSWDSSVLVMGFTLMSITSILISLTTGQLVDKFTAYRLLPYVLLPLGAGCLLLSVATQPHSLIIFMMLMGSCYGIYGAVFGAVWSEVYGTKHLGAIRSVVFAGMVLASALGPGITGLLIDHNVNFETQLLMMAMACVLGSLIQMPVSRRFHEQVLANNK